MATNDAQIMLRIPTAAVERADRLVEQLRARAEYQAFNLTRSAVLRLAVLRGLDALEAEQSAGPGKRRKGAP